MGEQVPEPKGADCGVGHCAGIARAYMGQMASVPRLFVTSDLRRDGYVALDDGQAKYLARVMRVSVGDAVRVFNGRDGEWRGEVDMVEGRSLLVKAREQIKAQHAAPSLTLLFAPLKKARTDFVVEKATELGVCRIQPVMTERTQASRVRADRLWRIAMEAAEQTERLDVPRVDDAMPMIAALEALPSDTALVFCDEAGDDPGQQWGGEAGRAQPMTEALKALDTATGAVLVGPEGGFSPAERETLRSMDRVVPVTLGPRILRAETAVVAALSLWQAMCGDWNETRPSGAAEGADER
ncbi:MAG: 16S rRNA (uracil(1498)-N(3))-methyltransferase [Pseudomonadota bacterium]